MMKKLKRSECSILSLVLKRKWYDMIASGEKREEYRTNWRTCQMIENWRSRVRMSIPVVEFRLGYASNAPRMAFVTNILWPNCHKRPAIPAWSSVRHEDWGEPRGECYVIPLGSRVEFISESEVLHGK